MVAKDIRWIRLLDPENHNISWANHISHTNPGKRDKSDPSFKRQWSRLFHCAALVAFTIFYAWQSDRDESLCKDLIREALNEAVAELTQEIGIDIVIDQDTQDVLGSPSIPDAILEKIVVSKAVVADLTLTHTSDKQVEPKKRSSNPNVMLEYGYALRAGDHNIIGVINTAFGQVEELAFDLRHKRCITYCAATGADENKRTQARNDLAKKFTNAIRPIVQATAGRDPAEWLRARKRPSASAGTSPEAPQQPATDTDGPSGDPKLDEIVDSIDRDARGKKKDGENWSARFSNGRIRLNLKVADLSVTRPVDQKDRDDLEPLMTSMRSILEETARTNEEYANTLLGE